jgi:hypothetical protein
MIKALSYLILLDKCCASELVLRRLSANISLSIDFHKLLTHKMKLFGITTMPVWLTIPPKYAYAD